MLILGFGVIEERERKKIRAAVDGALAAGVPVDNVLKPWNDAADANNKMDRSEAPERYTRVFYYGGKLRYHHINRQHALSPDGWGMLQMEEEVLDGDEATKRQG